MKTTTVVAGLYWDGKIWELNLRNELLSRFAYASNTNVVVFCLFVLIKQFVSISKEYIKSIRISIIWQIIAMNLWDEECYDGNRQKQVFVWKRQTVVALIWRLKLVLTPQIATDDSGLCWYGKIWELNLRNESLSRFAYASNSNVVFFVDVLMKSFESISKEHLIRIHIIIFDRKLWKLFEIHFDRSMICMTLNFQDF